MERRKFISRLGQATILPALVNGMSFRAFSVSPLLQALSSSSNEDHVLILVQLNGGNDGLNTVIPLDQYSNLAVARNNILIPDNLVLSLNGYLATGLHPAMTGIQQQFNNGKISIVQGVSYPSPNFSHFRATDIWMTASDSGQTLNSGWTGRYLNYEYPNYPAGYPNTTMPDPLALQIGNTQSLALQGPSVNMGMTISDPDNFYNLVNGIQDIAPNNNYGHELTYIRQVAQQSMAYTSVITAAANNVTQQSAAWPTSGTNSLADQLKIVSQLIAGGLKTKIYLVNLGGFDTHSAQTDGGTNLTGRHADLLAKVSEAVNAFMTDCAFLGTADRVVGMTFSEFGRRIISNGSTGTDHGAGAPMFLFGNKVQSGILGTNPIIPTNATVDDNVAMQYDFRSVYATLLNQWMCVPASDLNQIMLQNFQQLPIIQANACTVGIHEINAAAGESLVSCYPNPFTERTTVTFNSQGGHTAVQVFNAEGQLVKTLANGEFPAGTFKVDYENENRASGLYYLRMQNESLQQVKNMEVVK
ncbi:DUF1501 domain-containing protein [soil metagenome]